MRGSRSEDRQLRTELLGEQLAIDGVLAHLDPRARAVLPEDVDLRVHEFAVLQHLRPRLRSGIAESRPQDESVARLARVEPLGADRADEVLAPRLVLVRAAK